MRIRKGGRGVITFTAQNDDDRRALAALIASLADMSAAGYDAIVSEALRTPERQQWLYGPPESEEPAPESEEPAPESEEPAPEPVE